MQSIIYCSIKVPCWGEITPKSLAYVRAQIKRKVTIAVVQIYHPRIWITVVCSESIWFWPASMRIHYTWPIILCVCMYLAKTFIAALWGPSTWRMHRWQGGWEQQAPSQAEQRYISTAWPVEDTEYRQVRLHKISAIFALTCFMFTSQDALFKRKIIRLPTVKQMTKKRACILRSCLYRVAGYKDEGDHLLINEPFITHCKI